MKNLESANEKWLSAKEVAEMLGVNSDTILRWARDGWIGCVRISRKTVRFRMEDVRKKMEELKG